MTENILGALDQSWKVLRTQPWRRSLRLVTVSTRIESYQRRTSGSLGNGGIGTKAVEGLGIRAYYSTSRWILGSCP